MPSLPSGLVNGTGLMRGSHEAAFEPLQELLLTLALVTHPAVEKDERLHLFIAARGLRYDVATVGVADEHDRSGHRSAELGQVGGMTSGSRERVSESDGTESLTLQGADLRVEARRRRPRRRGRGRSLGSAAGIVVTALFVDGLTMRMYPRRACAAEGPVKPSSPFAVWLGGGIRLGPIAKAHRVSEHLEEVAALRLRYIERVDRDGAHGIAQPFDLGDAQTPCARRLKA